MNWFTYLSIAVGLAMDAFAVAVGKGLSVGKPAPRHYVCVGLWFGGFQALMPTVGFFIGSVFREAVERFSGIVAFVLLLLIGANMIRESFSGGEESSDASFAPRTMFLLAVATSIDALAVGISYGVSPEVNLPLAVSAIGAVTFLLSALGLKIGSVFGAKYKEKAELVGGVILVLMGVKMLLDSFGVLPF